MMTTKVVKTEDASAINVSAAQSPTLKRQRLNGAGSAVGGIDYRTLVPPKVEDFAWLNQACIGEIEAFVTALQANPAFKSGKAVVEELAARFGATAETGGLHLYFHNTPLWGETTSGVKTLFPKTTPTKTAGVYKANYALPKLILAANVASCAAFMAELNKGHTAVNHTRRAHVVNALWLADEEKKRRRKGAPSAAIVDVDEDGRVYSTLLPSTHNRAGIAHYEKMIAQLGCEDYLRQIHFLVERVDYTDAEKIQHIRGYLGHAERNLGFLYGGANDDNRHLRGGSVAGHRAAEKADAAADARVKGAARRALKKTGGGGGPPSGGAGASTRAPLSDFTFGGGRARSAYSYYGRYEDYPY